MSLMGTLAKVAIGIVVAKTVGGMIKGGGGMPRGEPGSPWDGGNGGGGGGIFPAPRRRGRNSGLEDMMGDIFAKSPGGASKPQPTSRRQDSDPFAPDSGPVIADEPGAGGRLPRTGNGQGGGLGDLLEQLGGGKRPGRGRIDDVLGGGQAGGLEDLLGGILGGARTASGRSGGFGEVLNDAIRRGGEPDLAPSRGQEAAAALMLRAMIQAAKSDGRIDQDEQKKLMDQLGQASPEEMDFVRAELARPIDVEGLCTQIPDGLQPQIYAMSLMAIRLDNRTEAQYLHTLAEGLGLSRTDVNAIHDQLQAEPLYR